MTNLSNQLIKALDGMGKINGGLPYEEWLEDCCMDWTPEDNEEYGYARGYNQALKDVKARLSKVGLDYSKVSELVDEHQGDTGNIVDAICNSEDIVRVKDEQ